MLKEIPVSQLQLNPMTKIAKEWMLITAGNEQDGYNTMTASWGHLGAMWGQGGGLPTAVAYLRPQRYTKEFVDRADTYTISFFSEEYKKDLGYLGSVSGRDEKDKIRKILENCKKLGYPVVFKDKKTIFDDSKIESHSAITPTYKIPDKSRLSAEEMQVYATVIRRFVAVFCAEDCTVQRVEMTVKVGELEEFTLKGLTVLTKGWMAYDDATQKDKLLPNLNKGDHVNIDFKPVQKETTPPKHYTIETLNNYLKNPFREEKAAADDTVGADDAEEYRAMLEGVELGTEATRTGIIDNARKSGYIQLKKDVYTILPGGEFLIESLEHMSISMDKFKTSEMGRALKRVFRGEADIDSTVALAMEEIRQYFERPQLPPEQDTDTGFFGDEAGACPLCGAPVVRNRYSYGCSAYKSGCRFSVNAYICGRAVSLSNMRLLLSEGKTAKICGFVSSKTQKSFDAALVLRNGRAEFDFT